MRTVIIVVLHAHTRVNASWMSVYCMCWHVCCVFTVQWATEGALHPADREDGGAEKEPASNRWNSIPGLGAAPSDCSHYGLHTNHTSLKILIADRLYMQAAADSWKAGNFTVVAFFFFFRRFHSCRRVFQLWQCTPVFFALLFRYTILSCVSGLCVFMKCVSSARTL